MNNNSQSNGELPSTKKLFKSTILAIGIAAIILVTTVLPAEYGIDPYGVGDILGLTKMGEIKVTLSEELAALEASNQLNSINESKQVVKSVSDSSSNQSNLISQKSEIIISLKPNEGRELKVYLKKGDQISYNWRTDGEVINFNAHTDSGEHHTYSEGSKDSDKGILEAFCDGRHGWWWRNRTTEVVTITLQVDGNYSDFREDF